MKTVGILALQGGYEAHARALQALGARTREVRRSHELDSIDGLVLPGGESGVQRALIDRLDFGGALGAFVRAGRPVLATCAGLILASREHFGWLDVGVLRNAYGAQDESFEAIADDGETSLVFIRAPRIVSLGPCVRVLATRGGEAVLVQQENVTGAAFHPELTHDRRIHARAFGLEGTRSIETNAPAHISSG